MKNIKWQKDYTRAKKCTLSHTKEMGQQDTHQIVFIASNLEGLTAKQHVKAFGLRWPIEKMFRTLKQSLGIQYCQSTSVKKQRAHIFATFLAFSELEIQKISKKKKSPEQVLKFLRLQNKVKKNKELYDWEDVIM